MAQDITEQASQDEIAESLMSAPEVTAEPQEQTGPEEQPVAEEQPEAEQLEAASEEDAEDWLPDEQSKIFPDETYNQYAQKRYPELAKLLIDKNTPEPTRQQVRQILHDKINTDLYFKQQELQRQEEPEQVEYEEPEPEPEPTPQPQITREQYFNSLRQAVTQKTDPQVAKDFFASFNKAFGVPDDQINALIAQNPNGPMEFTQTMSMYALNLINTFAQDIFGSNIQAYVEQAYPEFGQMYSRAQAANTWDAVRNQLGNAELPAYGTKEFSTAARQIAADIAGSAERFESMVFTDNQGRPLSPAANLAEKQRMIAERMANGGQEKVTPAIVAKAVQTGQKLAQRAQVKQSAGNLSSGKSKGQIANRGEDDFWADGIAEYQKQHGSL